MKINSKNNLHDEGIGSPKRDFELEGTVGNLLIPQYQAYMLKSRLADRVDGWWILSQDKYRNLSSFSFRENGQVFNVSLSLTESTPVDEDEFNDNNSS